MWECLTTELARALNQGWGRQRSLVVSSLRTWSLLLEWTLGNDKGNSKGRSSGAPGPPELMWELCALALLTQQFQGKVGGREDGEGRFLSTSPPRILCTHTFLVLKQHNPHVYPRSPFLPPSFNWMIRISLSVNPVNCSLFPTSHSLMRVNIFSCVHHPAACSLRILLLNKTESF